MTFKLDDVNTSVKLAEGKIESLKRQLSCKRGHIESWFHLRANISTYENDLKALITVSVECPPILHDLQYIYGLWLQYGCYEWVLNLACEVVQCVLYFIKLFNEEVYPAYVSVTWQPHFQALSSHWSYWPCYIVHPPSLHHLVYLSGNNFSMRNTYFQN